MFGYGFFYGKAFFQKIDWEKLKGQFEYKDERAEEGWRIFIDAITDYPYYRYYWLLDKLIDKARGVESQTEDFLAKAFYQQHEEIIKDIWSFVDTPEKAKEALLTNVYQLLILCLWEGVTGKSPLEVLKALDNETGEKFKKKVQEAKVQAEKALDELIQEGVIEFVPIYLPRLNKEKAIVSSGRQKWATPAQKTT